MPKREDEYWAAQKEVRGQALCPFCGSSNIYKRYKQPSRWWRCNKCEKNFPSPSYGQGKDFGKEARWIGKTTEEIRRREFAEAARKKRMQIQVSQDKKRRNRNIAILILSILVIGVAVLGVFLWQM